MAILPFMTLGVESGEQWLGEGLADALITRITSLKQIFILPTGAVLPYVGRLKGPIPLGKELHADLVLEGMIQRSGERVQVTVQLMQVRDGKSLWAENYDVRFTDIFAFEREITDKVVPTLLQQLKSR